MLSLFSRPRLVGSLVVACLYGFCQYGDAQTTPEAATQRNVIQDSTLTPSREVASQDLIPLPPKLPPQSDALRPQDQRPARDPRKSISGPIYEATDAGGLQRRALSDSWILDHNDEYTRGGPSPVLAKLQSGLNKVREVRRPGQIEVPVDTDEDGFPDVWIYYENDRPAYLEMDRFQTGCHDFRLDLSNKKANEYFGWTTTPPVPLNPPTPAFAVGELFERAGRASDIASRPTQFTRLAANLYPRLDEDVAQLATRHPLDAEATQQVDDYAKRALGLLPRFLQVHRHSRFAEELDRTWGFEEKLLGYDLDGNGEDHREVAVSYTPRGISRIQFFEDDWRIEDGFLASVEFAGSAITSLHLGKDRYILVGGYWLRCDGTALQRITERYLVPGYREWKSNRWYRAVALWRQGTQLAALCGELDVDSKGRPQSQASLTGAKRNRAWLVRQQEVDADRLPAISLLTLAADLGWLGDRKLTSTLRKLAESAVSQQEFFEALARYRLLLRFARKLDENVVVANTLEAMSELFRHVGNYDQALACLEESLEVESSLAFAKETTENLDHLRGTNSNPQELRLALGMRSHAMALNRGCKLGTIAALHAELGERQKAEGLLAEARRLIQSTNEKYCEADLLNLEASWDIADQRWEIAQQRLLRAMQIIEDAIEAQADDDRGAALLAAGQAMHTFIVPGKRNYLKVGMRSRTSPHAYRALNAQSMAELMREKSQQPGLAQTRRERLLDAATQWQRQALRWYQQGRDPVGLLVGRLQLAKILTQRKDYKEALRLNRDIVEEAYQRHAFEVIWQSLAIEGVIQSRQGHVDDAIAAFERAASEIEAVRAGIRSEMVRRGFFSSKLVVYEHLLHLYDHQRQRQPADRRKWEHKLWETMERAKARTLLDIVAGEALRVRGEAVKTAMKTNPHLVQPLHRGGDLMLRDDPSNAATRKQFLDQLSDESQLHELASLTMVQPVSLSTLQAELHEDEALLEYFVTEHDLFAALVTQDRLKILRIAGLGRDSLQKDIASFRKMLEQLDPRFDRPARSLYRQLLEPLLASSPQARRLCIVPAGPLHYVPFDAFLTPTSEFVAEKYQVSYAASASALVYAFQRRPPPMAPSGDQTLVVAEPVPRLDYGSLPGALVEGEHIRDLAREPKSFLKGLDATESRVVSDLESSRYFHFAGHTDLPTGSPMRAALLCTPDVDRDGRLEVRELFELDLKRCRVAVLSACETRLGRYSRGDEVIGLERAFLRAGVPTVVASLWKVDDAATSMLMEAFYTNLWKKSLPLGEALSQAQRSIVTHPQLLAERRQRLAAALARRGKRGLASASPKPIHVAAAESNRPARELVHPGYWAAFVLSGSWR